MTQNFTKGSGDNTLNFPLTTQALAALVPCSLASPRVGAEHNLSLPTTFSDLDALAQEVCVVRGQVERGEFPWEFMRKYYPAAWGEFPETIPQPLRDEGLGYNHPEGLANVVHMDNPVDMGAAILTWLLREGYRPRLADDRFVDFLNRVPGAMEDMSRDVAEGLERAFEAKYFFGVARPEEAMGWNMTHYPEGCPTHPSYPAGHGAAAGASAQYFISGWALDDAALKVVRDTAYIWAMARSLAGVHYAEDNLAGLAIGGLDIELEYST